MTLCVLVCVLIYALLCGCDCVCVCVQLVGAVICDCVRSVRVWQGTLVDLGRRAKRLPHTRWGGCSAALAKLTPYMKRLTHSSILGLQWQKHIVTYYSSQFRALLADIKALCGCESSFLGF